MHATTPSFFQGFGETTHRPWLDYSHVAGAVSQWDLANHFKMVWPDHFDLTTWLIKLSWFYHGTLDSVTSQKINSGTSQKYDYYHDTLTERRFWAASFFSNPNCHGKSLGLFCMWLTFVISCMGIAQHGGYHQQQSHRTVLYFLSRKAKQVELHPLLGWYTSATARPYYAWLAVYPHLPPGLKNLYHDCFITVGCIPKLLMVHWGFTFSHETTPSWLVVAGSD